MIDPSDFLNRSRSPWLAPKDLKWLRGKLIEERDRRLAEYERDITAAQSVLEEGREDFEELAAMDADREQLFSYSEQDRETLRRIEEALQRMDQGTYGLCIACGEPIPLNRLRAIPWARYGTEMQARIETGELSERGPEAVRAASLAQQTAAHHPGKPPCTKQPLPNST